MAARKSVARHRANAYPRGFPNAKSMRGRELIIPIRLESRIQRGKSRVVATIQLRPTFLAGERECLRVARRPSSHGISSTDLKRETLIYIYHVLKKKNPSYPLFIRLQFNLEKKKNLFFYFFCTVKTNHRASKNEERILARLYECNDNLASSIELDCTAVTNRKEQTDGRVSAEPRNVDSPVRFRARPYAF